jgi:hypothetical protein
MRTWSEVGWNGAVGLDQGRASLPGRIWSGSSLSGQIWTGSGLGRRCWATGLSRRPVEGVGYDRDGAGPSRRPVEVGSEATRSWEAGSRAAWADLCGVWPVLGISEEAARVWAKRA